MTPVDRLLRDLLTSVRRRFYSDQTKPGVVLSELNINGEIYASIVRYPNGPLTKEVIVSAKGSTLSLAIEGLALVWLVHCKQTDTFRLKFKRRTDDFDRLIAAALP